MALKFYIQVKGKVSGPLSGSDLMSLAQSGKLLPTNMVRQDGSDKRVQANRIRNLNFGTPQEESEEEIEEILEVEPVRQTTAPHGNNQPAQRRCFNSATTFQPWKPNDNRRSNLSRYPALIRPRPFSRGNTREYLTCY
jgi:hypothetical protein